MFLLRNLARLTVIATSIAIGGGVAAQAYPSRPITIVVPFAAGTPVDVWTRAVAEKMKVKLNQTVVVDNRPGANAWVGVQQAAHQPADGYTVLSTGGTTLNEVFFKSPPVDFIKTFVPVTQFYRGKLTLIASSTLPVNNLSEFVAYAKANPGKLNYGYASANVRMMMEQFKLATGTDIREIPYKTVSQVALAVLSGEVAVDLATPAAYGQFIAQGKARPLATLSDERHPGLPQTPTAKELGIPVVTPGFSGGFWLRAGSPPEAIQVLNAAVADAVAQTDVKELFSKSGTEAFSSSPANFEKAVLAEMAYWRKAAKDIGYVPDN